MPVGQVRQGSRSGPRFRDFQVRTCTFCTPWPEQGDYCLALCPYASCELIPVPSYQVSVLEASPSMVDNCHCGGRTTARRPPRQDWQTFAQHCQVRKAGCEWCSEPCVCWQTWREMRLVVCLISDVKVRDRQHENTGKIE